MYPWISKYWVLRWLATPIASRTLQPFLKRVSEVPPVRSDSACSKTRDLTPSLWRDRAVARPAIPPPTITTCSFRTSFWAFIMALELLLWDLIPCRMNVVVWQGGVKVRDFRNTKQEVVVAMGMDVQFCCELWLYHWGLERYCVCKCVQTWATSHKLVVGG